jgi:hypothetical protein
MTQSLPRPRIWAVARKLEADFPTITPAEIAEIVVDARRAVDLFGLDRADGLAMTEKIARERLGQWLAEPGAPEPRLNPETHTRRRNTPDPHGDGIADA